MLFFIAKSSILFFSLFTVCLPLFVFSPFFESHFAHLLFMLLHFLLFSFFILLVYFLLTFSLLLDYINFVILFFNQSLNTFFSVCFLCSKSCWLMISCFLFNFRLYLSCFFFRFSDCIIFLLIYFRIALILDPLFATSFASFLA